MKPSMMLLFVFLLHSALFAQSPKDYTQRGRELYEKQEFKEGLLILNKALEIDADFAQAYYVRGNIKDALNDLLGATNDYNSALERDTAFADAFYARGNVKMKFHDYHAAIADYSAAISINENFIEAYFNRGKARQFLQAFEEAINDCSKIIEINSKNIDAYYMRGILRLEFGDTRNGCLDLSKAGELGDLKAYEIIKEKCKLKANEGVN